MNANIKGRTASLGAIKRGGQLQNKILIVALASKQYFFSLYFVKY